MNRILSALALFQTEDCATELRAACATLEGLRLQAKLLPKRSVPAEAEDATSAVLFIECRADDEEDRRTLARLARPDRPPVIAIVGDATVADVKDLMRLGVTDVVTRPIGADDLQQALEQARVRLAAQPRRGDNVVAFLGSCGGAGTTTLAVQTALELVQREKRRQGRVCLLDFDLQFGNVALALDLTGAAGMAGILEAPSRFDAAFFAGALAHHTSGLDVLTAPGEIVPQETLTTAMAERIIALAQAEYDHVVIDLPHVWAGWTPSVLAAASFVAIVLCPDVAGVQRTRNHLRLMAEERLDRLPTAIIANRLERGWGSGWKDRLRGAAEVLGAEIAIAIGRDDATAAAARDQGVPLRAIKANSVIEKDVRRLVDAILSAASLTTSTTKPDPSPSGIIKPFLPKLAR